MDTFESGNPMKLIRVIAYLRSHFHDLATMPEYYYFSLIL